MSNHYYSIENFIERPKKAILPLSLLFSLCALFLLSIEKTSWFALICLFPIILTSLFFFHKNSIYFFTGSMFYGNYFYWPLRLQLTEFIVIFLLFFFLINRNSNNYNNYKLPKAVKISAVLLIIAVFLSEFNSPFFSSFTVYLGCLFLLFMISSYLSFKSTLHIGSLYLNINSFAIFTSISSIIIFIQIFLTGNVRSVGIAGSAIMDFTAMASLIVIVGEFLLDTPKLNKILLGITILVALITTMSRFAWLGFVISLVYALFILFFLASNKFKFVYRKIIPLLLLIIMFIPLIYALNLSDVISKRVGNAKLAVSSQEEKAGQDPNSLDSRIMIWVVAYNTFLKNPVTGVGYQMFSTVSHKYNVLPEMLYEDIVKDLDAHTTYLNFLADTGIIGLSCFLIYLTVIYTFSFKSIKISQSDVEKKVSIILNVLIFFIITHSIYSGAFTFGQTAFSMHFIIGLAVGNYVYLKNIHRKKIIN